MFSVHGSVRSAVLLPMGAFAALLAFAGCSRDQNHVQGGSADLTVRSLGALDVTSVVATVSGPSLASPKTFPLFAQGATAVWGGRIDLLPVGKDYVFTIRAVDRSNTVDYAGSAAGIVIANGQVSTVTITAQQTTAAAAFKNSVPVIDSWVLSSIGITPGATITAKVTAHDPNPGDTISFAWSSSPAVGGFSAPAAATTTWTAPLADGDQTLILTVTDNHGASTSASTVIHVSASNGRGQADVSVGFNTWPAVTDLVAAPGYIVLGSPTSVTATASDADGDALTYAWTSSCTSGSWSSTTTQAVAFTLPASATDTSCDLVVAVSDGRGGSATGQLTLPVGKPVIITPPIVTAKIQSTPVVDVDGSVNFAVEASDPEGSPLTFSWAAADGVLSNQVDGAGSSQVVWTAPATAKASYTVSVTVSNANGVSVQSDFTVASTVADGGVCECTGAGPGNVPSHGVLRSVGVRLRLHDLLVQRLRLVAAWPVLRRPGWRRLRVHGHGPQQRTRHGVLRSVGVRLRLHDLLVQRLRLVAAWPVLRRPGWRRLRVHGHGPQQRTRHGVLRSVGVRLRLHDLLVQRLRLVAAWPVLRRPGWRRLPVHGRGPWQRTRHGVLRSVGVRLRLHDLLVQRLRLVAGWYTLPVALAPLLDRLCEKASCPAQARHLEPAVA